MDDISSRLPLLVVTGAVEVLAFTDVPPACEGEGVPISEAEPDGTTSVVPLVGGGAEEAAETEAVESETKNTVVRTARGDAVRAVLFVRASATPLDAVSERPPRARAVDVATGGSAELLVAGAVAVTVALAAAAALPAARAARANTQPHHAHLRPSRSIAWLASSLDRNSVYLPEIYLYEGHIKSI